MTNLEKYRSLLHDGVQGLLLTSRYSRMYAAEFDIAEGVAVVSAQGARYFTDSRYIESAQKNLKGFEVVEIGLNNPMMQALKATLDEFGVETLGFEDEYLTVAELNGFAAALPVKFVPLQQGGLGACPHAQGAGDHRSRLHRGLHSHPHRHDREGARGRADLLPV